MAYRFKFVKIHEVYQYFNRKNSMTVSAHLY